MLKSHWEGIRTSSWQHLVITRFKNKSLNMKIHFRSSVYFKKRFGRFSYLSCRKQKSEKVYAGILVSGWSWRLETSIQSKLLHQSMPLILLLKPCKSILQEKSCLLVITWSLIKLSRCCSGFSVAFYGSSNQLEIDRLKIRYCCLVPLTRLQLYQYFQILWST